MDHPSTAGKYRKVEIPCSLTSYTNPDLPRLSVNLTDVLDHIEFSEKHREGRVKLGVMLQMIGNISYTTNPWLGNICQLCMGSNIEGTTAPLMGSDHDYLFFSTFIKAYCNKSKQNTKQVPIGVVLTRDDTTPAGYTKLQLIQNGIIVNNASDIRLILDLSLPLRHGTDRKGRLVMAHFQSLSEIGGDSFKHGPAETVEPTPSSAGMDLVRSFLCDDVTHEMEEWCMRDRIHDWPSKDTRDLFMTLGCFIVPVGHPSSPEKNIEWRMSFSLQERHLMWHLNPTQYHCFMLLKLIKIFVINRTFGDVLTSYQCKTLLFYTIERHEPEIWIPEKLILCLRMCLILLHKWISDKYIPNYFIPKENMFVKMDAALKGNCEKMRLVVLSMCSNWTLLFNITFSNFGRCLFDIIHCKQIDACTIKKEDRNIYMLNENMLYLYGSSVYYRKENVFSMDCSFYINEMQNALDYFDVVLAILKSSGTCARFKTFEETISVLYMDWFAGRTHTLDTPERFHQLTESFQFPIEDIEREPRMCAVMSWQALGHITLGSVLAASYFQTENKQHLVESYMHLELGKSLYPITSMLVRATVLLKRSLYDINNTVLNAAETMSKNREHGCNCYTNKMNVHCVGMRKPQHQIMGGNMFSVTKDIIVSISSGCFYFERFEFNIFPAPSVPLTFEAYRSFGINIDLLSLSEAGLDLWWADRVIVEPVMYLYYLQFLNNQPNNPGEAAVTLRKFENTLFGRLGRSDWPGHTDTWLNVLGDIFVKKGWTRLALRGFKYSDKLRPRLNAVRWHVMFLLAETGCNIPIIPDSRVCCCPHSCIVENVD